MKVYVMKHDGFYLPGYSVVVAENDVEAEKLMRIGLNEAHLNSGCTITSMEVDTTEEGVTMLFNGDY